jgi:predicted metal-dependent hydrolase
VNSLEELVPNALLKSEVRTWAKRIDVVYKEIHIRTMKRKWASCSSRGRLTFNTELLLESAAFRHEVIVHELLHLKLGGRHDKRFKMMLQAYLGVYRIG